VSTTAGRATLAWWALCLAWGLPALLLPLVNLGTPPDTWPAPVALLALRPELGWHQPPWVCWSTVWLHGSDAHLWRNLAALAALSWTGHVMRPPARLTCALALAWPLTQLGMLWQPELSAYVGLSGVLHAQFTVLALHLLQTRARGLRFTGAAMLAGLLLKVLLENPWQMRVVPSLSSAINVTPWVHFWGAVMGALCWTLLSLWHRPCAARPDSTD
jgi:hypothetical protein